MTEQHMEGKDVAGALWKKLESGKVRDRYLTPAGELVLAATDRVSIFDSVIGEIPGKGEVVTRMSEFWFDRTSDILPNHQISVVKPNITVAKLLTPIPIEVVVRGFMTGVTDTSIWGSYEKGERDIYGIHFRDGYKKNDKLDAAIITPTTKAKTGHDERLIEEDIVRRGIIDRKGWETVRTAALEIFQRAQKIADSKGFILVDTKMEFGVDDTGTIYVIDELLTPDSSRYWKKSSIWERINQGQEPENYDKEYLRMELKNLQKIGQWKSGDPIPDYIVEETQRRYRVLAEAFTKEMPKESPRVVVIMGSESDLEHAKEIRNYILAFDVSCDMRVASAHKTPRHLLSILEEYASDERPTVYIAIAGGSNALAAEIAGEVHHNPVISCPPPDTEWVDIYSSMHNPSGISVATILGPSAAAIHALQIFAKDSPELARKLAVQSQLLQNKVIAADKRVNQKFN